MATLKQFLQTGELGPIHPGMSEAEVESMLGFASDKSVATHPQIWKYGNLQLTFLRRSDASDRALAHIGLYFKDQNPRLPEPAHLEDFKRTADTTVDQFREYLTSVGLQEVGSVFGEDTNYLIMPSGARVTFDEGKLHSIYFAAPNPIPPKKQITVSVSLEAWNQLRALAQREKRSMADLCAEWIQQNAAERERTCLPPVTMQLQGMR